MGSLLAPETNWAEIGIFILPNPSNILSGTDLFKISWVNCTRLHWNSDHAIKTKWCPGYVTCFTGPATIYSKRKINVLASSFPCPTGSFILLNRWKHCTQYSLNISCGHNTRKLVRANELDYIVSKQMFEQYLSPVTCGVLALLVCENLAKQLESFMWMGVSFLQGY